MANLEPGENVGIPCQVSNGAFPGEYLVSFDSINGPVSGFVGADALESHADGETYLIATVVQADQDTVTVWIKGSFFTTTGLAYFRREWAGKHLSSLAT